MKDISLAAIKEKRKRRRRYVVALATFFAVYFVLLGAEWIILKSPFFRIQTVTYQGNATVPSSDISALFTGAMLHGKWGWVNALLGSGNMLSWPDELASADLVFNPVLKSVSVEKDYTGRSLTITTEERTAYGMWCDMDQGSGTTSTPSGCNWFDKDGVMFKRAIAATGGLILTVHDYSQHNLGLGSKVLPDEFLANVFSIFSVLQQGDLNVREIRLNNLALQEMEVDTYEGPRLYFSLRFPSDNDLAALKNFTEKPGFANLQYLDFRVENRVYYR